MREILSFFQDVEDPGGATPRPAEAGPRPAGGADDRAAVDARGRSDVRRHGGLRVRPRALAGRVPEAAERDSEPRHVLAAVPDARPGRPAKALLRLAQDWADRLDEVVAVDGKALRRSFEDAAERSPTHLLQAFASEAKPTLAQVEVDGKSNGIPALPALLELVDVSGRIATADAMHAQRGTAPAIVAKGATTRWPPRQPGDAARGRGDVSGQSAGVGNSCRINELTIWVSRLKSGAWRSARRRSATTSTGCASATTAQASRPSAR